MKVDLIPYQIIALSAPSTAGVPDYQKFVAPYEWKPRDQNVFPVKNFQAAIIKFSYAFGAYIDPTAPPPSSFKMQFKLIVEGSSDGMIYGTISEWTMDVPFDGTDGFTYEHILEIPLVGMTHLRPVLQSVDLRGRISVAAQMYLK